MSVLQQEHSPNAPPTKKDALILTEEGYYGVLGKAGASMEMPGWSLCMGNQAQIRKGSTAMSTSTRNFPNRLGIDTQVYLGSAELAAMCALACRNITVPEYMAQIKLVNAKAADVYRYMSFDLRSSSKSPLTSTPETWPECLPGFCTKPGVHRSSQEKPLSGNRRGVFAYH